MAIIYSYPTITPTVDDLVLGTDTNNTGKATRNFTVQSIIDLVTVATGDLQTVLDLGNTAINRDIVLGTVANPTQTMYAATFSTGAGVITGAVGVGFTDFTSTRITGTIQAGTAAQPNITSLGTLTSLSVNTSVTGTAVVTTLTAPGDNLKIASTKAIVDYIATKPATETLAETLVAGNVTGGTNIAVSAGDNIIFTDTSKALFGSGQDLEVNNDGIDSFVTDLSTGDLRLRSDNAVKIQASTGGNTLATFTKAAGVDLYFNNAKIFETLVGGAKVTGAFEATTSGTFAGLINTNSYTDSSGDTGTAGQILSSTGVSGTNWIDDPNPTPYSWLVETDAGTGSPYTVANGDTIDFVGVGNIATNWDNATKEVRISIGGTSVSGGGVANQVTYWDGAQTITGAAGFTFAGGATGKVAIGGELEVGGVLTDGTFTGSAGTYTDYASITSTVFVGPLQGNADTATALADPGTMSIDGDFTTTVAPTYTSGGSKTITANIADTVVTAKILTSLPTPTSTAIAASDTILAAMAKLQGQIDGIAGSLAFEGTWDASTGNPPSATPLNGQFWIVSVAGNTNLDGITDWLVGDWAIYVNNGAGTDAWQKLDQSNEVLGSGAANKIAKWTSTNTLATGLIDDDGTLVTIGNSGSLLVEGSTTLGDATTDTVTATGPVTLNKTLNIVEGIEVNGAAGTVGQVLTSGAGSGAVMSWTTPTTGTVESVGLTETGDALTITNSPITSTGNINIAGAGASTQYINGELNLVTFPTVDNYVSWTADSDEGTDMTVTSGFNLKFTGAVTAGGAGIATDSAVSANEMTIGLINAGGTPSATSFYRGDGQWAVPVGTKTETLAEVLVNGNTSGANDIVMADSQKITFGCPDLQLYHDTSNSYIETTGGSAGDLYIKSQGTGHDLYLQATDDVFIRPQGGQDGIKVIGNYGVELYGYNLSTSAMNKAFYISDLGSGSVRSVAEKGLSIKNGSDAYGLLQYSTQGAGNNRGGIEIYGGNESYGRRMFIGSAYIQGTTSSSPGFGLAAVVEFFPTNNPEIGIAPYQFSQGRAYMPSLKVGNTEITGNLTVDGSIIHGGGGAGIFTGSKVINSSTSVNAFTLQKSTGTLIFDVWLTSETSTATSVSKKYTVAHSYGTTPVYNKIIDTGPDGLNDFTVSFANAGTGGDSVNCSIISNSIAAQTIGYTVQVGHDGTNALTFTAG